MTKPCSQCGRETDELALFPGGICLDCYKLTPAARAVITADALRRAFGIDK